MNRTVCPNGMVDTCCENYDNCTLAYYDKDAEIKRLNEKIEFLARTNMLYSDWEHRETQVTSELIRKGIEEHKINEELRAEIERLTVALKKANEQAEHFEREWYLRGDELEKLKQEQDEPVAWKTDDIELYVREDKFGFYDIPLYTHPLPKRKPLTDEQIVAIVREASHGSAIRREGSTSMRIARAIESAHGIKE